eukprot:gene7990-8848_t
MDPGQENIAYKYEIIPAGVANTIEGLEIIYAGRETEIGKHAGGLQDCKQPGTENEEEIEQVAIEIESDEEESELLEKIDFQPVPWQFRKSKLRWILLLTGNFTKTCLVRYRCFKVSVSACISLLLVLYLAFTFGWIADSTSIPTLITADSGLIFTKAHDVIWELKWLLSYLVGLFYVRSGHLGWLFRQLRLPKYIWKKSKRHGIIYAITVAVVMVIIPILAHAEKLYNQAEKEKNGHHFRKEHLICDIVYMVFRLITLPSFFIVCCVLYIIKVQVDVLGISLKRTSVGLGVPNAKREIRSVKKIIRKTDTRLKWFLLLNLVLILVTAFVGLVSVLEQFEFKVSYKSMNETSTEVVSEKLTMVELADTNADTYKEEIARLYKRMQSLSINVKHHKTAVNESASEPDGEESQQAQLERKIAQMQTDLAMLTLKSSLLTKSRKMMVMPIANKTTTVHRQQGPGKLLIQLSKVKVLFTSIEELGEVAVLFLVPLMLLAWHERAIRRITDEIRDLDEEDQRRNYFLIRDQETKDKILAELKEMRGVSIFDLQVSFYKAALLAVTAPFITAVLHALFKQYKLY